MVVTRYDTGACVMAASAIAGVALSCCSLANNIGTVIALVGIVVGLFTSVNVMSSSIVINWTFVNNRKFALSILSLGATIGQTVMPYLTNALIEEYSWRGCLVVLGALSYFTCIPCGLIIHYSKEFFHKGEKSNNRSNDASYMSFLTDSAFIVFIVALFVFILVGPVEQWFVVDVAVLKGFGTQSGATLLSLNGIFGFVGRLIGSFILKKYPNTRPELQMCYGFLLLGIAHCSVVASPVYWGMIIAMVVRGSSASIIVTFLPSLQIELRGADQFPKTIAITYLVMGIGDILGGYIGGYSVDITGSYNLIFYIATAGMICCAMFMVVIFVIFKRRKSQYHRL